MNGEAQGRATVGRMVAVLVFAVACAGVVLWAGAERLALWVALAVAGAALWGLSK